MRKTWLTLLMWPLLALPVSTQSAPGEQGSQQILNGKKLPMGMPDSADFSSMHFQLASGGTPMFVSDDVVESQDEKGPLFGWIA